MGNSSETGSHKTNPFNCVRAVTSSWKLKLKTLSFHCFSFIKMFYNLIIIIICPQSGMCFYCGQPLPAEDKLADTFERTIQTEPAEAAQFNACSQKVGWHILTLLLSQCVGASVCALVHASTRMFMCVFSQKARGSRNRLHRATHIGRLLPTKAVSGTALSVTFIFLIADQTEETQRPVIFFHNNIPVCSSTVNIYPTEKLWPYNQAVVIGWLLDSHI